MFRFRGIHTWNKNAYARGSDKQEDSWRAFSLAREIGVNYNNDKVQFCMC